MKILLPQVKKGKALENITDGYVIKHYALSAYVTRGVSPLQNDRTDLRKLREADRKANKELSRKSLRRTAF